VIDIPNETVAAAVRGDQQASREIVERLHRPVLATIHRFVGRRMRDDVEDLAQEVFMKIFRSIDRFDPERGVKFTTWIYTFVRNHCFDYLKKRRLSTVSLDSDTNPIAENKSWDLEDAGARTPGQDALNSELGATIEAAMQELSDDHRMVLILREFEQLDLRSIAEIMDVSEGTIKSRLHRAKAALREKLQPYLEV
jgi:RNA polymerase sigma-70 factor (ECF subfamily)